MWIKDEQKFNSREELDRYIRSKHGEQNDSIEIELDEAEATKMQVSDEVTIYGAKIRVKKPEVDKKTV